MVILSRDLDQAVPISLLSRRLANQLGTWLRHGLPRVPSSVAPAMAGCRCHNHLTSRYSFLALFCFAVSQRHFLARKSLAFHMNLFCMMRQRRVSFFAGRSLPQLAADQSACQRDYSIR
jgi:hypothetical protein